MHIFSRHKVLPLIKWRGGNNAVEKVSSDTELKLVTITIFVLIQKTPGRGISSIIDAITIDASALTSNFSPPMF